jgi:hypothetical protein
LTNETTPVLVTSGDLGNMSPSFHTDGVWMSAAAMLNYRKNKEALTTPEEWRGEFELRIVHNGPITGTDFQNGVEFPVYSFRYGVSVNSVNGSDGSTGTTASDTGSDQGGWANILDPAWWWHLLWPTDEQWVEIRAWFEDSKAAQVIIQAVNFFITLNTYIQENSGNFNGKWRLQPTFLFSTAPGDKSTQIIDIDLTLLDPLVAFARTLATCSLFIATIFRIRSIIASFLGQNTMMSDYNEIAYGSDFLAQVGAPDNYDDYDGGERSTDMPLESEYGPRAHHKADFKRHHEHWMKHGWY